MSVDREAAVKKAEDPVREGKPDLAREEYLRLVEDQPGDAASYRDVPERMNRLRRALEEGRAP